MQESCGVITSEVLGTKGLHVLILKYRGQMDILIRNLTMTYNLTNWYKFQSTGGNTAICLKTMSLSRAKKIIKNCPKALNKKHYYSYGRGYLEVYSKKGNKTFIARPKGTIQGIDAKGTISMGHKQLLQKLGHNITDPNKECGSPEVKITLGIKKNG